MRPHDTKQPRESTVHDMRRLLDSCRWPAEAFWRWFELQAVRQHRFEAPVLEIGCGNGWFSQLAGLTIALGIDANPRAVARASQREAYADVRAADARQLSAAAAGSFRTVFANSVLEHIDGVEAALSSSASLLTDGGFLVATVPLEEMNRHLALPGATYARHRARALEHRNLWSEHTWTTALKDAGFSTVRFHPYLNSQSCKYWDRLDVLGAIGVGRVQASLLRELGAVALPSGIRTTFKDRIAARLAHYAQLSGGPEPACATMLVARK